MARLVIELLGWTGAVLIIVAYFLLTKRKLTGRSGAYQAMNAVGSVFVAINAFANGALPSLVINIVWLAIAVWGLEQFLLHHEKPRKARQR